MGALRLGEQFPKQLGNYLLHHELASGGMATVYLAQLMGPLGFNRVVAIKRMREQYARDVRFVRMFVDEAWLAARVHHPNVVTTLDVLSEAGELFIVMEYVRGESLSFLMREANGPLPPPVAAALAGQALGGLHAAHEANDEAGRPLGMIHRDVSPQNIVVGADGFARLTDFGIAKASCRLHVTQKNQIRGKLRYMSPEQIVGDGALDRKADVYAMGVILWEMLAGRPLFEGATADELLASTLRSVPSLTESHPGIPSAIDDVVKRATRHEPGERFPTAAEFQVALEQAVPFASARAVGEWTQRVGGHRLQKNQAIVESIEQAVKSRRGLAEEIRELTETAVAAERADRPSRAVTLAQRADAKRSASVSASLGAGDATMVTTPTGFDATREVPQWVVSLPHLTERIRRDQPVAVVEFLARNKLPSVATALDQAKNQRSRGTDRMPVGSMFEDPPTADGPTVRNPGLATAEPPTLRKHRASGPVTPTLPCNPRAAPLASPRAFAAPLTPVPAPPPRRPRWFMPLVAVAVLAVSAAMFVVFALGSGLWAL